MPKEIKNIILSYLFDCLTCYQKNIICKKCLIKNIKEQIGYFD